MSSNQERKYQCGGCGGGILKAHRIEGGDRYCAGCYPRFFERRPCSACKKLARLLKNDRQALCRQCQLDRPCFRCEKPEYELGKITPYGPVCKSCSVYFRSPKATQHKVSTLPEYGTCQNCRRHRKLTQSTEGRFFCTICLQNGNVPCPSCGEDMPAGRGKLCEQCYWRDTFFKRSKLDEAGFSTSRVTTLFREFGAWLVTQVPPQKAALSVHRYFLFFYTIEKRWGDVPSYAELLAQFNAEGLRRVRLPMRWLVATAQVDVNEPQREKASEQRRIDTICASIEAGTPVSFTMTAYKKTLQDRVNAGTMALRTMRLALRPAASLLDACEKAECGIPSQADLDRYLEASPGQKAAITSFISFLNKRFDTTLAIRIKKKRVLALRRKRLEKELIALASNATDGEEFKIQWISTGLAFFHGLAKESRKRLDRCAIDTDGKGNFTVTLEGKQYWLPHWQYRSHEHHG